MSTRTSPIARCPCAPSSVGASRCFPRASQMDGDTNSPVCTCWPAKPNSGSFGRRLTKPSHFCERTKRSYDDSEHIRVSRPPRWTLESNGGTLPCNPIDYLPNCFDSQGRLMWISSCRNTRQPTQVRQRTERPGTWNVDAELRQRYSALIEVVPLRHPPLRALPPADLARSPL